MKEDELNKEENNTSNNNENNELVLNSEAQKAIFKSHFKYYLTNGLLIFIPMVVTIIIYFKINNIDFDWNVLISTFWNILKKPAFFIPVIIAIFVKDFLKYIFCGMGKDDTKYIEEAEKENPKAEGIGEVLNAETAKKRFAFISLLFGLVGILFFVLIKQILNFKTLLSFVIAYLYSAHKYVLPYGDFQHIILNKTFLVVFLISLCVMNIFFKNKKNNSEQNTENEHTDIFNEIQKLIDNEHFEEAINKMLSTDLSDNLYLDATKLHKIAQCYNNMYNDSTALEYYSKALDKYLLCKDFDDTYQQGMKMHSIAQCYEQKGDYQNALEYYNKAVELLPDRGDFLFNKARILELMDDITDAMMLMDKALILDSNDTKNLIIYYSNIVIWYNKREDYESALKYIDKIIELEPNNVFALTFKANYYYGVGNTEKVIYYCNKVLDITSDNSGKIYQWLADCNAYLKDYQKAFEYYNNAIVFWTNFKYKDFVPDLKSTMAYLYFGAGCSLLAMKQNLDKVLDLLYKAKDLGFDEQQCNEKINIIKNKKEYYE